MCLDLFEGLIQGIENEQRGGMARTEVTNTLQAFEILPLSFRCWPTIFQHRPNLLPDALQFLDR